MTDLPQINPSYSPNTPWYDSLFTAKPVSGNALQSDTQALNSMGSPNLESSSGSGFAASTQGPTGGGFGATAPNGSVPNSQASQNASGQAINEVQNAATGNNVASNNATLGQQSSLGNIQSQLNNASPQNTQQATSQQSGLPSSLFSTAVQKLTGYAPSDITSGIKSAVNDFGTNLGFANGISQPTELFQGFGDGADSVFTGFGADATAATDALGGSLSLSGALGAAGLGYTGGSLLAGFTGENQTGGGIGGAAGAVAGAEIGSIIPGIGTIIGGLVGGIGGSLLGGLFGPGQATSTGIVGGQITSTGQINQDYSASKNGSVATAEHEEAGLSSLFSAASSALGIQFSTASRVGIGYNTLHSGPDGSANTANPGFIDVASDNANDVQGPNFSTQHFNFNPADTASVSTAYFQALNTAATASGYTDSQALYNWFYGQPSQIGSNPSALSSHPITIAPKGTYATSSIVA